MDTARGFFVAAAFFAVWLGSPGRYDDVLYRIHFPDSVSGLTVGDSVKYRGVDVGTVKSRLHRARRALRDRLAPIRASLSGIN